MSGKKDYYATAKELGYKGPLQWRGSTTAQWKAIYEELKKNKTNPNTCACEGKYMEATHYYQHTERQCKGFKLRCDMLGKFTIGGRNHCALYFEKIYTEKGEVEFSDDDEEREGPKQCKSCKRSIYPKDCILHEWHGKVTEVGEFNKWLDATHSTDNNFYWAWIREVPRTVKLWRERKKERYTAMLKEKFPDVITKTITEYL